MLNRIPFCVLLMGLALSTSSGQNASSSAIASGRAGAPAYNIVFREGEPVSGVGAIMAMRLPFECTGDGTVFITMVQPLGAGNRPPNVAWFENPTVLLSIAASGKAHSFLLDQVPDLYDLSDVAHFAGDSQVLFLLRAAARNGNSTGSSGSSTNSRHPEHHTYMVSFSRDGEYQKTVQIEDAFPVNRIGLFPTGNYLAYGYNDNDHSPELAMLKGDGSILEYLQIPKGDAPKSAIGALDGKGQVPPGVIAPVQFVGRGHSILVLQSKTEFPILEVRESGTIREIHPKLPAGTRAEMIIPSDTGLYARVDGTATDLIYQLDDQTGDILKVLQVGGDQSGANVACVNNGRFMSFEDVKGKFVPLIGSLEADK